MEKTEVWVAMLERDPEPGDYLGVFLTQDKAMRMCEAHRGEELQWTDFSDRFGGGWLEALHHGYVVFADTLDGGDDG